MEKIPLLLMFLGHVWVDASQGILPVGLGFGMGGLGVAVSGLIADAVGLYSAVWILALVPVLGSLLAPFIRTPGGQKTPTEAVRIAQGR